MASLPNAEQANDSPARSVTSQDAGAHALGVLARHRPTSPVIWRVGGRGIPRTTVGSVWCRICGLEWPCSSVVTARQKAGSR